jgi:RNA polymerase sigma-70 factor (ECF subfamily)
MMDHTESLASAWAPAHDGSVGEFSEFVGSAVASAQDAHRGLTLERRTFAAYVASRIPDPADCRAAHWADLYVACACATRVPGAAERFQTMFLAEVPRHIGHVSRDDAFAAEVRQRLLVRVLGDSVEAPRILDYTGRGPLRAWVRVGAIRIALNLRQSEQRMSAREQAWGDDTVLPAQRDPELELLRRRCAADVRMALEETMLGLDRDARNVLRMHYIDGLSAEDVAVAYGVHRATVARWIQQAHANIMTGTRRRLAAQLRLQPRELDSLIVLVRTSLNLSLCRLLAKQDDPVTGS